MLVAKVKKTSPFWKVVKRGKGPRSWSKSEEFVCFWISLFLVYYHPPWYFFMFGMSLHCLNLYEVCWKVHKFATKIAKISIDCRWALDFRAILTSLGRQVVSKANKSVFGQGLQRPRPLWLSSHCIIGEAFSWNWMSWNRNIDLLFWLSNPSDWIPNRH